MATITIQFEGICCHIKPPAGSPQRRSVLPHVSQHIPYIEMYTNDVDTAANPDFTFTMYTRENASYQRTDVNDVKVELMDVTSAAFTTLPSFGQRVPSLQAVEPRFGDVKANLLGATIPSSEVAAYFDMTGGTLSGGPAEHFRTVFDPEHAWPIRHLAQWVALEIDVSVTAPRLRVTDLASNTVRTLRLKDGADLVTIGNQTLLDILGQPGATGHFVHYYDLAAVRPINPVPDAKQGMGLAAGCSNTQWP